MIRLRPLALTALMCFTLACGSEEPAPATKSKPATPPDDAGSEVSAEEAAAKKAAEEAAAKKAAEEAAAKKAAEEAAAKKAAEEAAAKKAAVLAKLRDAKATKKATSGEVTVKVSSTKTGKTWKFDRSGYQYMVRESDKGSAFHWLDLEISTESKDPKLPSIFACRFSDRGDLEACDELLLKFYRWDDYGTYLGNYADSGNDFAKRDTVKFTAGYSAPEEQFKQPTVVVLMPDCQTRNYERFERPPVFYVSACEAPTLDQIGDLPIVEILNKKALEKALGGAVEQLTAGTESEQPAENNAPTP